MFSSPERLDQLWRSLIPLLNGCQWHFCWG